jgi:hypothetical protein
MKNSDINASDRTLRAYAACPAEDRAARWAAYQRALRLDGYRAKDAPDDPEEPSRWVGPSSRGGPRPGAGRHPRAATPEREDHTIQFTPDEWIAITAAARREGTTPGRWLREVGVRAARAGLDSPTG